MEVYMDDISDIKFNFNSLMADALIKINDLKNELLEIEKKISLDCDNEDLKNYKDELLEQIEFYKKSFIKEFQAGNKEEISKYLELRNE